jgi:hypothetical protein
VAFSPAEGRIGRGNKREKREGKVFSIPDGIKSAV